MATATTTTTTTNNQGQLTGFLCALASPCRQCPKGNTVIFEPSRAGIIPLRLPAPQAVLHSQFKEGNVVVIELSPAGNQLTLRSVRGRRGSFRLCCLGRRTAQDC